MDSPILLSVPNVSEGRDAATIAEIGTAFTVASGTESCPRAPDRGRERNDDPNGGGRTSAAVRLLDVHSDPDHHRSVFTLVGGVRELADALIRGGRAVVERVDVMARADAGPEHAGRHPHVGALDVVPVVYLDLASRGAALAAALLVADRIGDELGVPVFLYGELTADASAPGRTRAELRRGGTAGLAERMAAADPIRPDFGPARMHTSAGATLVAARPPLVAFNLELASPSTLDDARRIAALIREGGAEGLPGVRAIGIALSEQRAQVSMNVERPLDVPLALLVEAVATHARIESAELVGLAPRAAFEGFPREIPMPGFDPARHVIENAIGS